MRGFLFVLVLIFLCLTVCGGKKKKCRKERKELKVLVAELQRQLKEKEESKVDGGWSDFGDWSECSVTCGGGIKERRRTCTSPPPSNGGAHCDGDNVQAECCNVEPCEANESGESGIRSYGGFCVAPNNAGCSPPDGTYLIFTKNESNACDAPDMRFILDSDGVIHHKCSNKVICPEDNDPTYGKKLMLKDSCDLGISRHVRLPDSSLKNLSNGFCVHPNNGWPFEGNFLVYWPSCSEERLELDFFDLDPPTEA